MSDAFDQSGYQVRLDWGLPGLARITPADVTVVVDVLRFSSTVSAAVAAGRAVPLAQLHPVSINGAAVTAAAGAGGGTVLVGGLRNAAAVARAALAIQHERAARTSIAVVAAGELGPDGLRFAVEDLLGAGAVVAALGELGVDHVSPDAAAAGESFRALRGAVRHLLTASGSGRELAARGRLDEVHAAAALDADAVAPVLRDGALVPF